VGHIPRGEIKLVRQPEIACRFCDEFAADHADYKVRLAVKLDLQ
jgi:hypothetical protein